MPIIEPTEKNILKAAEIIKNGGIVAFPTETVYGLGGSIYNEKAIKKIFNLKKRPYYDPLIVHISSFHQLKEIAYVDKDTIDLLKKLWPGPFTIILKKKPIISNLITANLDTVAIRYPKNTIALKLIKYSSTPVAAPSANKFSKLSPTKAEHVLKYFKDITIIDGGKTVYGVESTVAKIEGKVIYILRHGAVTVETLKKIWKGEIRNLKPTNKLSPGLLKKHYSPNKKLLIVKSQKEIKKPQKSAFISFGEKPKFKYAVFLDLSPKKNLNEASSNLFEYLHIADENPNVEKIYVKQIPLIGIGRAIMERLKKAQSI